MKVDFKTLVTIIIAYWKIILTYRGMMLIHGIRLVLMPMVMLTAWLSIERTSANPYSDSDYLFYYMLVPVVLNLTDGRIVFKLPMAIRMGTLNRDLVKPFPAPLLFALESFANNIAQLIYLIPFTLIVFFIFHDQLPSFNPDLLIISLFFLSIVTGALARMFVNGTVALAGFWLEDITTLNLIVNGGIWALLGGMIIPVATFPERFRTIAGYLPYRYMLSFPIEMLSGQLSKAEILHGFVIATTWIAFFSIILRILWKKGLKKYTAYGG